MKPKFVRSIILLILAVSLAACSLTACDILNVGAKNSADELIAAARAELASTPYKTVTELEFKTDDESLKDTLDDAELGNIVMMFDGDNFTLSSSITVGDMTIENFCVAYEDTLYQKAVLTSADVNIEEPRRAQMGMQEKALLLSRIGTGADIDESDFLTVSKNVSKDGVCTVTATDIKPDSLGGITAAMQDKLGISEANITVVSASYSLTVSGGSVTESTLTVELALSRDGTVSNLTATLKSTYSFDEAVSVLAPSNASDYQEVSFSEILG